MKQNYFIYHPISPPANLWSNYKWPIKVAKWNGITYIHKIMTFFLDFWTISYFSNNLTIHLSVSIIFNIIKSKAFLIRSAPNNLCHNHKWPIKQPSKMELHVWEWPIITAMSSGVKLHLILGIIIIYQVINLFLFF